MNNTP